MVNEIKRFAEVYKKKTSEFTTMHGVKPLINNFSKSSLT